MAADYDNLYSGKSPQEAIDLLISHSHGQLSHWNQGEGRPEMAFLHYAVSRETGQILAHFSNNNPMLALLEAEPRATFWLEGPTAYVPSHWYLSNRDKAVPTSYYSWAQFEVEVEIVQESQGMLEILHPMLGRFQGEGDHPPMDPAQKYWQGMLGAISGLRMTILSARSRHKYGQNRPEDARREIAARLSARGMDQDKDAARQVLARL